MLFWAQITFWTCLVVVGYTYIGYGIVVFILDKLTSRPKMVAEPLEWPKITLLIAAYNEESIIQEKIENTLSLEYPKDKIDLFFVTDGSTDETGPIISGYSEIRHFHEPGRKGKIHAVNRVMKEVTSPIVIFSDANTLLNQDALKKIARHYTDEKVGGVAGEKRIFSKSADNAAGAGEGLYWKYESFLKKKDSDLNSVVGAAGELFSIRTSLFQEPPSNIIIEDFYISLKIASSGYRFVYEPEAYATETASASVDEEWKRKVRISAGGIQAIVLLSYLLNPFKYGLLSFQYISHRVLRWTLAPLALPILFISNAYLAWNGLLFFQWVFLGQVFFYVIAGVGYLLRNKKIPIKGFFVPYYFSVMNLSVYAGFFRYLKGKQSVVWEKSKRAES